MAYLASVTEGLSRGGQEYVVNYFLAEQPKVLDRLKAFWPELKTLNPEIEVMNFNPQKMVDFFDLYIGMTSRYHPEDIEYFYYLKDFKQADAEQNRMQQILGVSPGFRMEPKRMQHIIDEITKQKNDSKSVL